MQAIHKFPLHLDGCNIQASAGARPLHVAMQGGQLMLWCLVDTDAIRRDHAVYVFGTGYPITRPAGDYVGTVHQPELGLVWHVFMAGAAATVSQ